MDRIRIAHISDLHFSKVSLSPLQFFSKRWLGNFNLIFSRKKTYLYSQLESLISLFHELKIEWVVVTGDLSTTSLRQEFQKAKAFFQEFENLGIKVVSIPGNHDHYTKNAWKTRRFYQVLNDLHGKTFSLKNDGISAIDLNATWVLIALDTALATPLTSSRGFFSEELEQKLTSLLSSIPPHKQILLLNHFPLFEHERSSKTLKRASSLRDLLKKFPNVRFYLNGHTHTHCIADLRSNGMPIILDSGSASHHQAGSWNLLDLYPNGAEVQAFRTASASATQWQPFRKVSWSFQ